MKQIDIVKLGEWLDVKHGIESDKIKELKAPDQNIIEVESIWSLVKGLFDYIIVEYRSSGKWRFWPWEVPKHWRTVKKVKQFIIDLWSLFNSEK